MALEAVALETPALAATSMIVGAEDLGIFMALGSHLFGFKIT
jgi:hypothetical protein